MSTSTFSVRVDSVLKTEVEKCLADMGMSMSTAINIYLRQIARQKSIPFIITSAPLPNRKLWRPLRRGNASRTNRMCMVTRIWKAFAER